MPERQPRANALFRTVLVSKNSLTGLHDALDTLAAGGALDAAGSGVVAEDSIQNLRLIAPPTIVFDGFNWNACIFVSTA